jgi:hypothetical protein
MRIALRNYTVAAVTLLTASLAAGCTKQHVTAKELDRVITTAIPVGSTPAQVASELNKLGIEHASYDSSARMIRAIKRKTWQSVFVEGWIQIFFSFDGDDRLVRHVLREGSTGP